MNIDELMGKPHSVRVVEVIPETKTAKTIIFRIDDSNLTILPGQFLMIWIPEVDEIPMSISLWKPPVIGVTVLPIGEATESLCSLKPNDWIGIRGPFGSSFTLDSQKALVVGGGVGMAPLRPLVNMLLEKGIEVTVLIGSKTKHELFFFKEFSREKNRNLNVLVSTDDGSEGFKGLATEAVKEILDKTNFDSFYTCGPELMMHGLYEMARNRKILFQASLERFMKCGCGICGTCALDPTGSLVCIDGPVYTGDRLSEVSEFGRYHRNAMGLKKKFGT